jgi:hypothetical protein
MWLPTSSHEFLRTRPRQDHEETCDIVTRALAGGREVPGHMVLRCVRGSGVACLSPSDFCSSSTFEAVCRTPALPTNSSFIPGCRGVGKTPMTALLAGGLKSRGESTAIVTMGYGRRLAGDYALTNESSGVGVDQVGDEAAELHLLTHCPVYVGDEPSQTIHRLDRDKGSGWIIFDDGVSRTWDRERRVVMLGESDLARPIRYLPLGAWRVTPEFLRSATYVAVTTTAGSPAIPGLEGRLRQWGFEGEVGWFRYVNAGLQAIDEDQAGESRQAPPLCSAESRATTGSARA